MTKTSWVQDMRWMWAQIQIWIQSIHFGAASEKFDRLPYLYVNFSVTSLQYLAADPLQKSENMHIVSTQSKKSLYLMIKLAWIHAISVPYHIISPAHTVKHHINSKMEIADEAYLDAHFGKIPAFCLWAFFMGTA